MHCNDELGHVKGTSTLGIGEGPDFTQEVIGKAGSFKDLFCEKARQEAVLRTRLVEERGISCDFVGSQGWDTNGRASRC